MNMKLLKNGETTDSGTFDPGISCLAKKPSRRRSQALMFRLIKSFQIILVNSYTSYSAVFKDDCVVCTHQYSV